jgi:multidrug efflux pump subunit AcrA (membrane-fusion protein)
MRSDLTSRNSRRRFLLPAAVAAAAILAAGCRDKKAGGPGAGAAPPPMPVEVAQATRGDVRESLHALGTIEAAERVKVTAEIDAIVRELPFEEGRIVRKGQVLAVLNDSELRAEAVRAAALRNQAKLTSERFEELSREKIASPQDRDNAVAALQVADANVRLGSSPPSPGSSAAGSSRPAPTCAPGTPSRSSPGSTP